MLHVGKPIFTPRFCPLITVPSIFHSRFKSSLASSILPNEIFFLINVDEIVSLGAAVYAIYKGDKSKLNVEQKAKIEKISVEDVTPAYFGCIVLDYEEEKEQWEKKVSIVIEKNIKRPCTVTKRYQTPQDDCPKLRCRITQSMTEVDDPEFVTIVWDDWLGPLPSGNKKGDPVDVTYSYDDNGIMHASFLEVNTGIKKEISLDGLSEGESIKID